MNPFDSARRELLKFSGIGLAASAVALPAFARKQADASPSPVLFDVRMYGATGDGKTVDSAAVNKAIEAAAAAGGGCVIFPAGVYVCFSIRIKSNIEIRLSQGATIVAAESPLPGQTSGYNGGTYDPAEPDTAWNAFQDYGHNHWHNSLFWGEDIHDFAITGPGLIWGQGLAFGSTRAARGNYPIYRAEQPGVGNKAIALKNCHNVQLRDFYILKGGHMGLLLTGVDNAIIDNLTIDTDRDGIDIDCCKNVRVSNCTVNSPWDDAICPKSSFALGYSRPTENVTITSCYVSGCFELGTLLDGTYKPFTEPRFGGCGRIKCGTESNGGFKNITISNCVFDGCQGLALETVDGAQLEDITVTNLTMRNLIASPIFLRLGSRMRGPADLKVGTLHRVLIDNVTCYNPDVALSSILSGIPGYSIRDVKLSNIYIEHQGDPSPDSAAIKPPEFEKKYPEPTMFGPMPAHGFYLRHIQNLEMSHVEIQPLQPDLRPAFYLDDVNRADFIAVTAPVSSDRPAFALSRVTDLRILISRAAKDIQIDSADARSI
jgi:polygalacturonase